MNKEKLFIFDKYDNLLAVTNNYIEARFKETVEKPVSFFISFPMTDEDAPYLIGGNQVAFRDLKGNFRLFTIREIDDQDGEATEKVVKCMPGMQELTDVIVEERRPQDRTAKYVLGLILENSRWQVGSVAELGKNSTNFYFKDAYTYLGELTKIWGGEIVDRIEIEGNRIAGRYIDIVHRKGSDTGKRFEIGKDIKNITRTVLYYPKTALYGKGSSLQTENEGHTRKITFRDVVWSKEKGDPVDKPKGQEWVGDPEAREKHGIPDHDTGKMMHRFGPFEDNDEEDPEVLLEKTWQAVQDEKEPKAQYKMDILTFYGIAGYEHEQVFLGDTGIARDKGIKPMVLIEARIMSWEYDIGNPRDGKLVLGNILDLNSDDSGIDWVIDKVKDNAGNWDAGGGPITDDKFPDIKPNVPTNVKAEGLFKGIMLSWDFESTYAIAAYEVYASQTNGFAPDPTNLVFRGKVGGYNYGADTDEKWYFRVRAMNTHGTTSDYSEQVSASTAQLDLPDLEHIVPDFIEYGIYEGGTAPSPSEYKFWVNTSESPRMLYQWDKTKKEWIPLAPTNPEHIGAVDQEKYNQKVSSIEKNAEEIALNVSTLETNVEEQGVQIQKNQSTIQENAEGIALSVKEKIYNADMEDMTTRVSEAESSIKLNADEIVSKVSKNGVISSINQSPESIKLKAERIEIDGDLLVKNGKVYIKDGVITNELIAGNANIDFAKIANVKITNAMIQSVNAAKINAGVIDANKVTVRVTDGNQAIQMNDKGFESVDNNGNVRIHIGIRDIGGKGESDPSTIRFFGGSGHVSAGVGMNVNNTFVVGSNAREVGMELRTHYTKNTIYYARQHRFVMRGEGMNGFQSRYFRFLGRLSGTKNENPVLEPSQSGWGYVGTTNFRLWRVYTNHLHYYELHKLSTRDKKENIRDLLPETAQHIFNQIDIKRYHYINDDGNSTLRKESYGPIAEDCPNELLDIEGEAIVQDNYLNVIAGSLQHQTERIDLNENEIVSLKKEVKSLKDLLKN
ncbi:phage tail spike protein [Virgibacillus salexigens]|uniref:phage tail spike protein n=1 Tax=Virgibacillus salexigens TaxID=61016 RepID=UPI0019099C67|nr:phage tail spike protein [Virgibacillus salexigens]